MEYESEKEAAEIGERWSAVHYCLKPIFWFLNSSEQCLENKNVEQGLNISNENMIYEVN